MLLLPVAAKGRNCGRWSPVDVSGRYPLGIGQWGTLSMESSANNAQAISVMTPDGQITSFRDSGSAAAVKSGVRNASCDCG